MSLSQKSIFCFILFFPILSVSSDSTIPEVLDQQISSFQLARLSNPDEKSISVERDKSNARYFHKHVVTTGIAVSVIVALYVAYQVREAFIARDAERVALLAEQQTSYKKQVELVELLKVSDQKQAVLIELLKANAVPLTSVVAPVLVPTSASSINVSMPSKEGWGSWVVSGTKSFAWGTSKFMADSALLLASGTILNGFYNYTVNKIAQVHADETVLWYAYEQTKISNLFNDLKLYATDYDLYATLLSTEAFNQDAQLHLQAFVQDLLGAVNNHIKNEIFADQGYFGFLVNEMKKKYVRKGIELEKLNDYIVPAIAKRNRALIDDQVSMLFAQDENRRNDIAEMCNLLSEEMTKLTAFIALRGGLAKKARIEDIVAAFNAFLDHMEKLLNSTPAELEQYSKANRGMFTSIYEYEKLFSEQINFLHRYCKLNS